MQTASRKVVLLMNLGSPDTTSVKDVRKYLNEFLMDGRVIDIPVLARTVLVKGIIVPFRSPRSARAYKTIWTENGSPLIYLTYQLQAALQDQGEYPVEVCMRYGSPSPAAAFEKIREKYPVADEVILFPLYPHYAMSSYETAVEYAKEIFQKEKYSFQLSVIPTFYNDTDYIHALTESIKPYLSNPYDLLLFSYHGIPERHVRKTDVTQMHCLQKENCCDLPSAAHEHCYRHQVFMTSSLTAIALQTPKNKFATSFQSRLGRDAWLKPYTAERLKQLPGEGVKKLVIVCPAFVSDCLETLEEMGKEGRAIFLEAGGESFTLVPCLNIQPLWIETMHKLIGNHISGTQQKSTDNFTSHVSVH